jgi:hypothetical protein
MLHYNPRHVSFITCPSSGGQIVLSQHLVSSLPVQYSTVCRMRADLKICNAEQAKQLYQYKNTKIKLYKNNAAVWYNKTCRTESALFRHTVQPFTESDDTRCCDNTICPPEDGHVDARNMSRIVM